MSRAKQTQYFREKPSAHEIVIAPICIVSCSFLYSSEMLTMLTLHQPVDGLSCGIVPSIPGYHQQLLQVGFCSERSHRYANSCLFKVISILQYFHKLVS
jgi:hypothetical protein